MIPAVLHRNIETNLENSALSSLSLHKYELGNSSEFYLVLSVVCFPWN